MLSPEKERAEKEAVSRKELVPRGISPCDVICGVGNAECPAYGLPELGSHVNCIFEEHVYKEPHSLQSPGDDGDRKKTPRVDLGHAENPPVYAVPGELLAWRPCYRNSERAPGQCGCQPDECIATIPDQVHTSRAICRKAVRCSALAWRSHLTSTRLARNGFLSANHAVTRRSVNLLMTSNDSKAHRSVPTPENRDNRATFLVEFLTASVDREETST